MELIQEREYFEDAMAKHDFEKADFYMEQMKKLVGKDASTQRYICRESTFLDYYMQRITAEQLVEALEELAEEVVPQYKKFLNANFSNHNHGNCSFLFHMIPLTFESALGFFLY